MRPRALAILVALSAGCGGGGGTGNLVAGPVDLGIDRAMLLSSLEIADRRFEATDCAVAEGAVGGTGRRRLLLFSLAVINHGDGDLVLGDPRAPEPPLASSDFVHSLCQDRLLLAHGVRFELRDTCGIVVATREPGLLLRDSAPYGPEPSHGFDDAIQGLTAGWGSVQEKTVEGQWLDITGVPPGGYTLVVTVNADGKIVEEDDVQPDTAAVAVVVDEPAVTGATPGSIDITVDRDAVAASVQAADRVFDAADCAVIEGGVGGAGLRRLVVFDAAFVNYGEEDLALGDPSAPEPPFASSDFDLGPCEGPPVFRGWARYELRVRCGGPVVAAHDRELPLRDSTQVLNLPSTGFDFDFQGISSGWASVHPGEWIDITGVPEGLYDLVVTANADGRVAEAADEHPDRVTILFRVPDPAEPLLTPDSVDLTVDRDAIIDSFDIVDRTFSAAHCAFIEGAVGGTGVRRLLRFDTIVVNLGEEDAVLGDPADPEPPFTAADFIFSPCHGHYHFEGWATYALRDAGGAVVAVGHKQAFCLLDSIPYSDLPPEGYDCDFQGISSGWGDVYGKELDGQWVDITGVPEGDYDLVVTVNAGGKVLEATDVHPNSATVAVHVPDPTQPPP